MNLVRKLFPNLNERRSEAESVSLVEGRYLKVTENREGIKAFSENLSKEDMNHVTYRQTARSDPRRCDCGHR